jgi:hypothetical protein
MSAVDSAARKVQEREALCAVSIQSGPAGNASARIAAPLHGRGLVPLRPSETQWRCQQARPGAAEAARQLQQPLVGGGVVGSLGGAAEQLQCHSTCCASLVVLTRGVP